MTVEQKIQLRVTSLQHAETINQQRITLKSNQEMPNIIAEAQAIYEFLTQDILPESALIKPLVN